MNELFIGVQLGLLMLESKENESTHLRDELLLLSANLAILTFILSQWVFVYQYLKVAILMPYILGLDENEERAVRNEAKARRNLTICNYTFVIFSIACIVVNYLG